MAPSAYFHKQTSPVWFVLVAVIAVCLLAGWHWRAEFWAWFSMVALASVCLMVLLTLTTLTIQGRADRLEVRFGPLPLFTTHLRYEDIREFQVTRSRIIDGWGVHYIPGRGWTWSLWGFDCVDFRMDRGFLRLGTDDAANLAEFLHSRGPQAKSE